VRLLRFFETNLEKRTLTRVEDWNHINPFGGRTRGRDAVLKELKEVHSTFLKGVTDTIEEMDVRFATPEVAVVTVTSRTSTFTSQMGSVRPVS
jgi:hypothetical protein